MIPKLINDADLINELNELIEEFNTLQANISLAQNFNGQIIKNIKISAGQTAVIPHKLGIIPSYRIILRQVGNGVVTDTPSDWNTKSIKLKNNGAEEVTLTVFLVRE